VRVFDSGIPPNRYGKGLNWTGYTAHDAAGTLLRYLKTLPEPVIPWSEYAAFTAPLRLTWIPGVFPYEMSMEDHRVAVVAYQRCIVAMASLNRQLLLYLLDLLAVFASKADLNQMTPARLVAHFQPGLLAKPPAEMTVEDHEVAALVMVFLIENQDNFLIGMADDVSQEKEDADAAASSTAAAEHGEAPRNGLAQAASPHVQLLEDNEDESQPLEPPESNDNADGARRSTPMSDPRLVVNVPSSTLDFPRA
jgi:GTPase-activating protein SAC7